MSAFALNAANDVHLSGGQLARALGADFVVQSVKTRLKLFRGEWWLDFTQGTPWYQNILVSPADLVNAEAEIKKVITGTDGVTELQEFSATFDAPSRVFSVAFRVMTEFGPSGEVVVSA